VPHLPQPVSHSRPKYVVLNTRHPPCANKIRIVLLFRCCTCYSRLDKPYAFKLCTLEYRTEINTHARVWRLPTKLSDTSYTSVTIEWLNFFFVSFVCPSCYCSAAEGFLAHAQVVVKMALYGDVRIQQRVLNFLWERKSQ